ncbi:hypothetical protein [Streptomyces sp. SID161]|uniref:hypothetical protein n=1 Tax=Streptomyces sp. SID161 TaxID=2690251 RepID=UPI0019263B2B|nr:hypothetical protein [Streptomyces sp. SID161]
MAARETGSSAVPPLPPLLGTRRAATDPSDDIRDDTGAFDAALDDAELRTARAASAQGRRQAVRALLVRTGDDWDRRGHRLTVLAQAPHAAAWAHDWLAAEPGSADAATLLALALVHRALRGAEEPGRAREAGVAAAALAPADPTPWLGLLLLARACGPDSELLGTFAELRRRHPEHHHAHHLLIAGLAERAGTGRGEGHEVYDAAEAAAAGAPADSPLAVLPVVAYAERYRVLAATGLGSAGPSASRHWSGSRARRILSASFDWWLEWEQDEHPRRLIDLNHLAFALSCAGRPAEAAALFQRIGDHPTAAPWTYAHHDPRAAFRTARDRALGR